MEILILLIVLSVVFAIIKAGAKAGYEAVTSTSANHDNRHSRVASLVGQLKKAAVNGDDMAANLYNKMLAEELNIKVSDLNEICQTRLKPTRGGDAAIATQLISLAKRYY